MSVGVIDRAVRTAAALNLASVPEEVIAQTGRVIADTVGVARAGARSGPIARLVDLDAAEGFVSDASERLSRRDAISSRWPSTVLTTPTRRSSAAHAAFLNATAGTFLELDEGMRPTGHPGMHIVPAALAVAECLHSSGSELLRSVLAGYEVTSRLFRAFRLRYPVHPHGHFGAVGAAVASALLSGVDPVESARIASTTPLLSMWNPCYEGATTRNTYTGIAARSGVYAVSLVRAGFQGSEEAMRVAFGEIAGELADLAALEADLDYSRLGITRNYFKLHSACALTHAAIDAVMEMAVPSARQIDRVVVETVANNMKIDRQSNENDLSTRFSLQYAVATALLLRRADPDAFRFRPEVANLARKVTVSVAPDLEAMWPQSSPARVRIEWHGGTATRTVRDPHGYYTDPITSDELREKFARLVDAPAEASLWWEQLTALPGVADCAELLTTTP